MSLDIINSALADLEHLRAKLESLRATIENDATAVDAKESAKTVKDRGGRLTEFGVAKLREWLDAGCYSQTDIAKALDITPAAVNHQKNRYLAERHNS